MALTKMEIITVSLTISAVIVLIWNILKYFYRRMIFNKRLKRSKYIKQLLDDKKITLTLIDMKEEKNRLKEAKNHSGIIVDGVLYNDKNAYFIKQDELIYIIGKKEEFIIAIHARRN